MSSSNTFLYFAFGSNMMTKRIHINLSSANFISIGKLKDYKLSFYAPPPAHRPFQGAGATIKPTPGAAVWGAVYELNENQQAALDRQEASYNRIAVSIEAPGGDVLQCCAYQYGGDVEVAGDIRPSTVFKHVLITGAKEHGLPQEYIDHLREIEDNGYSGLLEIPGFEDANKYIEK